MTSTLLTHNEYQEKISYLHFLQTVVQNILANEHNLQTFAKLCITFELLEKNLQELPKF